MNDSYTLIANLEESGAVPGGSILSRTLQSDANSKVILFRFAPGQELSAHAAPFPATLQFVSGEAQLKLGDDWHAAQAGTFVYMTPKLEHAIKAQTETVMLLTMIKAAVPPAN